MRTKSKYLAIILAAGKGTRLNSNIPKPLYKYRGIAIIDYILQAISSFDDIDILTVVGNQKVHILQHIEGRSAFAIQKNQIGTANAVSYCIDSISNYENSFIFVGDTPLISKKHLQLMIESHEDTNSDCTFLYSKFPIHLPYARLFFDSKGNLEALLEYADNSIKNKESKLFFTSQYLFKSKELVKYFNEIKPNKLTNELNLTDIINIFINHKRKLNPLFIEEFWSLMGINSKEDIDLLENYNVHEK